MSQPELNVRIIIFDGICNLCSGGARFLERHQASPPFALIPMQAEEGKAILVEHGLDPDDPTTFLVLDGDRRFTESDAWIHVVSALGGPWRLIHAARIVPRSWRNASYRLIARNRYRWFGRRTTCYLPR
jgi:predicted DCC family thiol-disulfide oxidoreductase YuxK